MAKEKISPLVVGREFGSETLLEDSSKVAAKALDDASAVAASTLLGKAKRR